MAMTILLKELTTTVMALAPQQQEEVLHFARFLAHETSKGTAPAVAAPARVKSMFGLLGQAAGDITFEEIKELRREMWPNFPREFPE